MVSAVVDVLGSGHARLAGKMLSFDYDRYALDLLTIARRPSCIGHRRLSEHDYIPVAAEDYVVSNLAQLIAERTGAPAGSVTLATEREFVVARVCAGCGESEDVYRTLFAYRLAPSSCRRCGSAVSRLATDTMLPLQARLSEVGVPPGKAVRAHVNGTWRYAIPQEGGSP